MENVKQKVNIDSILEFIENNFKDTDKSEKIRDFGKLVSYFKKEGIELSLEDAETLIKKSSKLVDVIECVQNENVSSTSIDSIENLFLANDLSKDFKEETYLEDSSITPQLSKSTDIDTLKLYLTSMPRLLTVEEERSLAERISQGDEKAKSILVEHNLRLAVSIAKRYVNHGVSFNDLIQEGNIGLMIAADRFDKSENCKFSTYATWWIRQRITRYIADNSRTARIPVYMHELILKVDRARKSLALKLNRDVTREDIAEELNLTVEEILKIEKYSSDCVSLEAKVQSSEESDASDLGAFIADENAFFEGKVIKGVYLEQLKDIIFNGNAIDEKQKKVLQYRYGFVDGEPKTLEEVGKVFGVTRERIRQIEAKALRALRNSGTLKEFRPEERDIDKKDGSATRAYSLALRN